MLILDVRFTTNEETCLDVNLRGRDYYKHGKHVGVLIREARITTNRGKHVGVIIPETGITANRGKHD